MRQEHRAGEKLFVDYAGQTMEVLDGKTGEIRKAEIFVATLGASNLTYCEATWTQDAGLDRSARSLLCFSGSKWLAQPSSVRDFHPQSFASLSWRTKRQTNPICFLTR